MKLSFVIPCYRSEKTIEGVVNEIIEVVSARPEVDFEIITVNDGSPDGVWEVLCGLSRRDERIKSINLAKNGGKHIALLAGFSCADGDIILNVDDDGQCPVDHLWELLKPIEEGYDVAIADYPRKAQSGFKNVGSKVNDTVVRTLLGKPKGVVFTNFIARRRFVCEQMVRYRNPYPFLEGLTLQVTRNIALVPMEERRRVSGTSNYRLSNSLKLLVNSCTSFSVLPLRLSFLCGLVLMMIGFILGVITIVRAILSLHPWVLLLLSVFLLVSGLGMLLLGLVGEYVGRSYISLNDYPQYVIRDKNNL